MNAISTAVLTYQALQLLLLKQLYVCRYQESQNYLLFSLLV